MSNLNNIEIALATTINALAQCIEQGISNPSDLYELAKAIGTKYDLNFTQVTIMFEEALKVI